MADPVHPRLDVFLKTEGHFPSREAAQAAIREGRVIVDGAPAGRPSERVRPGARVMVTVSPPTYVSRGGQKLEGALRSFRLPVRGRVCLDVGAGTGGFTDCLLRSGAVLVHAVDVGRDQLAFSLRADPRVRIRESTDVRHLAAAELEPRPSLATVDVSFISLRLVLSHVRSLMAPDEPVDVVALVKPQFEAGRGWTRKGIVRQAAVHRRVLGEVLAAAAATGLAARDLIPSPLRGTRGNAEFLLHLVSPGTAAVDAGHIRRVVEEVHHAGRT